MFLDSIITVECWPRLPKHEDTWAYVEPGDMLVYDDGTSYFVEGIALEEPHHVTFRMRAVVLPPESIFAYMRFWDVCHYSVDKRSPILDGISITKG